MMLIADRTNDAAVAATAVGQLEAAYEVAHSGGQEQASVEFEAYLAKARTIRYRLGKKQLRLAAQM